MTRIQIGTAQFGNIYGLTNEPLALKTRECWDILDFAIANGINEVDSSPNYGESLSIISKYRGGSLKVTSKVKIKGLGFHGILETVRSQIEAVGALHSLHKILIHDFAFLDNADLIALQRAITEVREVGFGISVYNLWEVHQATKRLVGIETIQFPINILNQEFLPLIRPKEKGTYQFIARSLMLQGAIDWQSERNVFRNHPSISRLRDLGNMLHLSPIELVIAFAKQIEVDFFLFGFASKTQLRDFLEVWSSNVDLEIDFSDLRSSDLDLIDPRRW